jgi:polyhydroxyalkanoate synthesis repressor PhaR
VSEPRIIKKYPNRRLYDTEVSRYITIADLKKRIIDGVDLEVVDASSGENITRSVLLQIITEQESTGQPLFTTDVLTQMIRNYGSSTQETFASYITQCMELFVSNQEKFQQQVTQVMTGNPVEAMTELTRKNMEIWKDVQESFMRSAGFGTQDKKDPDA